ncbi:hypothetical protein MZO42_12310 [Sphingomonas psychrotolerans]|uniref:Uncharacterized protein n=1 Tax=Sphingomonas psychrotolerans TaxID=1327635 RepID=A0ABU3N4L9_9SPHN|nr:hypothetical protein [Sphingomonas psychrotolerans]MDT8759480.1 hypothetical protein [Sphingomonas psychrotolerans]
MAVLIGLFLGKLAFQSFENRPGKLEAEFETTVQNDPNLGPMFQAFRQYFPNDYAALKAELIAQHRAGATPAQLNMIGFTRMGAFRKAHVRELAQAPSAEFQAFRKSQAALIKGLASESPTICAQYTFATIQPGTTPSPKVQKLLADFGAVQFRAIAAGQKAPAKRDLNTMTKADSEALLAQMKRAGLDDRQLNAFLEGTGARSLSETDQCRVGVGLSDALAALPADQAERILAVMTAHS